LEQLLRRLGLSEFIPKSGLIAVKLHFGERGNLSYIHPCLVRGVVDQIGAAGGKPFLTDTNSLYVGSRSDAVRHLETAYHNGFGYQMQGTPVIIADGLRGADADAVEIKQKHFEKVDLASQVCQADAMVCLTHFKAHEMTGFGGALKNVGMGLAARSGKLAIHSTVTPYIAPDCIACGSCIHYCPSSAITLSGPEGQAVINSEICLGCGQCIISCPEKQIHLRWDETVQNVQEKICEYAYGLLVKRALPSIFLNFLLYITPLCDCYGYSGASIVSDIGILGSHDPVAIDQASADLVNDSSGLPGSALASAFQPGEDKFRALFPQVDWSVQLAYGEQLGLGCRDYELVSI